MLTKFIGLFIFVLSAIAMPAYAVEGSIEQLGSSAIEIQPSTEARKINSVKTQDLGDASGTEQPARNSNQTPDYQNNVLNNNYMTAYGRVKTTTENENNNGPMEANEPNTAAITEENSTAKKTGNDKLLQQEKKYNQTHQKSQSNTTQSHENSDKTSDEKGQP